MDREISNLVIIIFLMALNHTLKKRLSQNKTCSDQKECNAA